MRSHLFAVSDCLGPCCPAHAAPWFPSMHPQAPETIREGELSPACDVYAWGVLLWEMITGGWLRHLHRRCRGRLWMLTCSCS